MALFLGLVLTIALSLLFSFLLAKLLSSSSSSSSSSSTNSSDGDGHVSVLSPRKLIIQKLVSCERLFEAESIKNGSEREARAGFVAEVVEADDFRESKQGKFGNQGTFDDNCGCGSRYGSKIDENGVLRGLGSEGSGDASEFEGDLVVERTEREKIAKIEEDVTKHEVGVAEGGDDLVVERTESEKIAKIEEDLNKVAKNEERVVSESECDKEILGANKNEENGGGAVCDCEEIMVDGSTESGRNNKIQGELCKREMGVDESENDTGEANKDGEDGVEEALYDDWEGIERTELERLFGSAVAFLGSKSNADRISNLGSVVMMQLYGFHKIATQGPCHEPQPMALKVSARANWYMFFA